MCSYLSFSRSRGTLVTGRQVTFRKLGSLNKVHKNYTFIRRDGKSYVLITVIMVACRESMLTVQRTNGTPHSMFMNTSGTVCFACDAIADMLLSFTSLVSQTKVAFPSLRLIRKFKKTTTEPSYRMPQNNGVYNHEQNNETTRSKYNRIGFSTVL